MGRSTKAILRQVVPYRLFLFVKQETTFNHKSKLAKSLGVGRVKVLLKTGAMLTVFERPSNKTGAGACSVGPAQAGPIFAFAAIFKIRFGWRFRRDDAISQYTLSLIVTIVHTVTRTRTCLDRV